MNRAEVLGPELVMLFRREADHMRELDEIRRQIGARLKEIREAEAGALYAHTGEMPAVQNEPPPERFERRRVLPRPMRAEHTDGGETFALNPVMAAVTETLPAVVPCSRQEGGHCQEIYPHMHLADGSVTRVRDL